MLRRIDVTSPWRSLTPSFWPTALPLGKGTVVYGHNGSGKSTLAELLLNISEEKATINVSWEWKDGRKVTVRPGSKSPSPAMAVFTRSWVEANLSQFLSGENADAIVTLGESAIGAKEEEDRLQREIDRLKTELAQAADLQGRSSKKVAKLAREVQDRIVTELQRFDYGRFTKNRYSIGKVGDLLRTPRADYPGIDAHTDALIRLGEDAPTAIPAFVSPPAPSAEEFATLGDLLGRTPTRVALAELDADPDVQNWAEIGLSLHERRPHCLFCAGIVRPERLDELARHFDESWLRIRAEAQGLLGTVARRKGDLTTWLASLPAPEALASDLRPAYERAANDAKREINEKLLSLEKVEGVLCEKVADPSATLTAPDMASLGAPVSATVLSEAIAQHNDQVHRHEELKAERLTTVFDHIVGAEGRRFLDLERQASDAKAAHDAIQTAASLAEKSLDRLQQEKFTTKEMADKLTGDLARVYGKHHLSIAVTADGKSYSCRRGGEAGTNLSEGERTTLSLLYFLRNLKDQESRGVDSKERIVVIDDPSSSLDREALFSTHQWLVSTLSEFGQYVVLTHDFNLLRLFITSHRSKWNESAKEIGKDNAGEINFPRVAFREMFAVTLEGKRVSKIGELPNFLRNNTTEYGYLFQMVMKGIEDPDDHERLFLLPNAARRVLEVFASYRAPHRPNFAEQLKDLVADRPDEQFRAVYDFCNRFSHGEGHETVEVLDARAVQGDIRRCMEFLRDVDPEHFENMCKAVKIHPTVLG